MAEKRNESKKSWLFMLSVGSLAAAGLIAAIGVLIGGDSWKSLATAGLIFALNILVLISSTASHQWLKLSARILSALAVASSLFFLWVEVPYSSGYDGAPISALAVARDWALGSWIAASVLCLLCLLSMAWKHLSSSSGLRLCYALSFAFSLAASAVFWVAAGTSSLDRFGVASTSLTLLGSALAVLAAAGSLIVIVTALFERAKSKKRHEIARSVPSQSFDRTLLRAELLSMAESGELAAILLKDQQFQSALKSAVDAREATENHRS